MRILTAAFALGLGLPVAAFAVPLTSDYFTGAYTAINLTNVTGAPTINDAPNNGTYLPGNFAGTLYVGQTTAPQNFLLVSPTSGSGTVNGSIQVDFSFTDTFGSKITSVSNTVGGNTASLINGQIQVLGNYAINYAAQTDCITWAGSCTPESKAGAIKTQLSDTILISFADGAALDVNLYSWEDWNMEPLISFGLVSAPGSSPSPVPEPASLALFATALAGLALLKRRALFG